MERLKVEGTLGGGMDHVTLFESQSLELWLILFAYFGIWNPWRFGSI